MTDHKAQLINHLLALGSTPDEIATTLRDLGIKGWRDRGDASCHNPIERYLRRQESIGGAVFSGFSMTDANVGGEHVYLYDFELDGYNKSIGAFLRRFIDRGEYPELVEK